MKNLPKIPEPWNRDYQLFEIDGWAGWISKKYWRGGLEAKLSPLAQLFGDENVVKWYKNQRNKLAEVVWPITDLGIPGTVVLKSFEPRSLHHKIRLYMGQPRSIRHWNNIWILNEKEINTPQPVLLALPKVNPGNRGLIAVETALKHQRIREILTSFCENKSNQYVSGHDISEQKFSEICGKYVREIHDRGLVHRDLSSGNILIPENWDGTEKNLHQQFIMLDINRIRQIPEHQLDIKYRTQDMERLNIADEYIQDYYYAYCGSDQKLRKLWPKFLKYRNSYRRIRNTKNPKVRGLLKIFTYWPRTK